MAGELKTSVILDLVDRITAPARRVAQALSGLSRRSGLENLKNSARGVQVALGNTIKQAASLGKGLAIAGGAAAGAAWAITRMVGGVATLGNEIKISSERLGVGAEWLQEWQYAAQQFGVGNDALIDGLKELGLRADEFVMTGAGGAAESFQRLGITVKDLRGTAGETEKLLDLVLGRMGKIQNDAAKQRIFDEMFGGSGGEQLVTMLTRSREELTALRQAARDNGAILSEEDIEQSRQYVRQINELTSTLQGLKNSVLSSLLPTVNQWLAGIRELSKANREIITTQVLSSIRQLWTGLRAVGSAVSEVAEFVGGFSNLILIVSGLLAGKFILSLLQTLAAFYKLGKVLLLFGTSWVPAVLASIRAFSLALILSGGPITLIIAGITALAAAAYLIYRNWDGLVAWFGNLWRQVKAFFDQGLSDIVLGLLAFSPAALLVKGIDAVFELFGARPLSQVAREWGAGLADGLRGIWAGVTAFFDRGLGDIARDLLSFSPAALLVKAVDGVFELFGARPLSQIAGEWLAGLGGVVQGVLAFNPAALLVKALDAVFELFGARPLSQVASEWAAGLLAGLRGAWAGVSEFFDQGLDSVSSLFDARGLIETGRAWIGGLGRGIGQAWSNVTASFSGLWQRVVSAIGQGLGAVASVVMAFSPAALLVKGVTAVIKLFDAQALSQAGSEWVGGLWAGIRQRFEQMTGWLKQQVSGLAGWMPDWMKGESSLGRLGVPAERAPAVPALGPPVTTGRAAPMGAVARTDVGGELRIRIDSEGRPRVASMKSRGGLDYSVETGTLGVIP